MTIRLDTKAPNHHCESRHLFSDETTNDRFPVRHCEHTVFWWVKQSVKAS
jgi:hypothetical protein